VTFRRDMPYNRSEYLLSTGNRPDLIEEFDAWLASSSETLNRLKTTWQLDFSQETGTPAGARDAVDP